MFSSSPNYSKLKTNLRLAVNRLKLLEKKKTELALKARKEIADYLAAGKTERAKIRVEHIIREDYLVEAMEVTEMYCDLLLARFGLIEQMKDLDEGLAEAISSLIWVTPRLMTDVAELKLITDNLTIKYGKPYAQACREQAVGTISDKLIHKLSVQAPPKILVENYLIEIAKNYNIEYEPDPQVMQEADWNAQDPLINLNENKNNLGGGDGATGGGGIGGMNIPPSGFNYPPSNLPPQPSPFDYPQKLGFPGGFHLPDVPNQNYAPVGPPPPDMSADTMANNFKGGTAPGGYGAGSNQWDALMGLENSPPPPYSSMPHSPPSAPPSSLPPASFGGVRPQGQDRPSFPPDVSGSRAGNNNLKETNSPKPAPRSKFDGGDGSDFQLPDLPNVPELPSVPGNQETNDDNQDDIDFDDLNKRFEKLKKKK